VSTFAARLKRLRGELPQAQIAKEFGVSQQTWNTWEKGRYEPSLTKLMSICSRFKVSADWLLGIGGEGGPLSASESRAECSCGQEGKGRALAPPLRTLLSDLVEIGRHREATLHELTAIIDKQADCIRVQQATVAALTGTRDSGQAVGTHGVLRRKLSADA
jgi:DNA-binding XRE family transcriptional regulator